MALLLIGLGLIAVGAVVFIIVWLYHFYQGFRIGYAKAKEEDQRKQQNTHDLRKS